MLNTSCISSTSSASRLPIGPCVPLLSYGTAGLRRLPAAVLLRMQAEVASVPNATPINEWAERVTNGLIPQVVSPSLNFNMVRAPA